MNNLANYSTSATKSNKSIITFKDKGESRKISFNNPEQLEITGDGNLDFNKGKKSKYAYPIIKVYELTNPISLEELKNKFGFVPPQAFSYAETFTELTEYIIKAEKVVVINR